MYLNLRNHTAVDLIPNRRISTLLPGEWPWVCVGFHPKITDFAPLAYFTRTGESGVGGEAFLFRQVIQRVVSLLVQERLFCGGSNAGELQFVDVTDLQSVDDQVDVFPVG